MGITNFPCVHFGLQSNSIHAPFYHKSVQVYNFGVLHSIVFYDINQKHFYNLMT